MADRVRVIHSTQDDLARGEGRMGSAAIIQWAIRFCQEPEAFPVFAQWVRSIWADCPYTDAQISQALVKAHDMKAMEAIAAMPLPAPDMAEKQGKED